MLELTIGTTDQGYLEEGPSWRDGTWPGGFKLKYRAHPPGEADADSVYSFFGLEPAIYSLYLHWESQPNINPWRTVVPHQIYDSDIIIATLDVDQSEKLLEFWKPMGSFNIQTGTMRVVASSVLDNWMVADGVRITKD